MVREKRTLLAGAGAAALLSLLGVYWVLALWKANLALPLRFVPIDDTKFYLMLVKGMIDHGGYLTNSSLGAPFGQQLYDYPQGIDDLNLGLVRVLTLFSSNPALVTNLFFLATFPITALAAYFSLTASGVSRAAATVGATIFTLLPYHFFRGESHLMLSSYYGAPLTCYLFLALARGKPLVGRALSRRTLGTVALCLAIGSDGLYYATFALVLLGIGTVLIALARREPKALAVGAALVALIGLTMAANLAPSLAYQAKHGPNTAIVRSEANSEQLGLKLTSLVLPVIDHRFAPLSKINTNYSNAVSPGYCEACFATLGTVGDGGFLWLLMGSLLLILGGSGAWLVRRLDRGAALGVLICFFVGTIGGVSGLIAFAVTPNVRGWNRISLLIAFFSLLAVAQLLDVAREWLAPKRRGALAGAAIVAALLAFGVWDETSNYFVQSYPAIAHEWNSDATFVHEIQQRLAPGSSIFQLPYVPFPEGYPQASPGQGLSSPAISTSYELVRGYLHSTTLRWSYGAMKGRPSDFAAQLSTKPLALVLPAAAAAGFGGLWVDPSGYASTKATTEAQIRRILGEAPLLSPAGDLWFFDLRTYAAALRASHPPAVFASLRAATLYPLAAACSTDALTLTNPGRVAQQATLAVSFSGLGANEQTLALDWSRGGGERGVVSAAHPVYLADVLIAPGQTRVGVSLAPFDPLGSAAIASVTLVSAAFNSFGAVAGDLVNDPISGVVPPACTLDR